MVLVPMLGRAHTMPTVRDSLHASTDSARILWIVTHGDAEVLDGLDGDDHLMVPPRARGDYAHKINVGVKLSIEPLIFTGACDLAFHPGWLDACQPHLDAGAQVVGTNDLTNPRTAAGHSTHSLVTRGYTLRGLIDGRPGLLCEDYVHEYVDDELIGTASKRQAYAHAPDAIVEHLHPMAGKAPWDPSYRSARSRMRTDLRLFGERRALWT